MTLDTWTLGAIMGRNCTEREARAAAIVAATLVVPLRLWSMAMMPDLRIYALFPWWLQALCLLAFAALGLAAWRGSMARMIRAVRLAFLASIAAAVVQGIAAWQAGAWVWWVCMAAVCAWIYWRAISSRG